MKREKEQNKRECIKKYLKVVISKQILNITIGPIFLILEYGGGGEHTLKCKGKIGRPLF